MWLTTMGMIFSNRAVLTAWRKASNLRSPYKVFEDEPV
jgi:hypothetical protein